MTTLNKRELDAMNGGLTKRIAPALYLRQNGTGSILDMDILAGECNRKGRRRDRTNICTDSFVSVENNLNIE